MEDFLNRGLRSDTDFLVNGKFDAKHFRLLQTRENNALVSSSDTLSSAYREIIVNYVKSVRIIYI